MKKICILLVAFVITACASGCEGDKDKSSSKGGEPISFSEVDIPDSDYVTPDDSELQTQENDDGTLSLTLYLGKDTALEIPSEIDGKKITNIGNSAFKDSILEGIKLPETIVEISPLAFHSCQNLVEVELSEGLVNIGNAAFFNCTSLYKMEFPSTLESIGENCFYSTPWLYLQFNKDEDFIVVGDGYLMAYNGNQANVEIPDNVRIIGSYSFYRYADLKKVTMSDNVEIIGERAFYDCSTLNNIELSSSLYKIGRDAFYNCNKLSKITLPSSVTELGSRAIGYYTDSTGLPAVNAALTVTCSGDAAKAYMEDNGINYKTE